MRFEQLECLLQIAETGSFTDAAQKLYLTQQAVSMNIKQLEQELGETLITRENTHIYFTECGERVLESARKIIEEKNNIMVSTECLCKADAVQYVSIGSTSCVANLVLPRIIKKQGRKQKIRLDLTISESAEQVIQCVQNGENNIGLILYNAMEFERLSERCQEDLVMEVLVRDEIISVVNRKDYDGESDYWEKDVMQEDLLLATYNIESIEKWKAEIQQYNMIVSNDAEFIRALLDEAGVWVTMAGLSYQMLFSSKKYVGLPVENLNTPLIHAAVYRKDADPFLQEFVRMVRKELHMK